MTKGKCRNPNRENWVIEMPPAVFRHVIAKGTVVIDLLLLYVEEYTEVAVCYACCRYGHVAKHCKHEHTCYKCGGKHEGKACKKE